MQEHLRIWDRCDAQGLVRPVKLLHLALQRLGRAADLSGNRRGRGGSGAGRGGRSGQPSM